MDIHSSKETNKYVCIGLYGSGLLVCLILDTMILCTSTIRDRSRSFYKRGFAY